MGWPIPADEENPWRKITYTLEEEAVPGYTCEYRVAQDGFCVTNIHVPESFDIPVAKHWEDSANKYKYRPKSITVRLLANGEEVGDMVLTQKEKWRGVFKDEPVYAQGKPIEYTIVEDEVKRYKTEITGSAREGFTISNSLIYGYDFRFTKVWQDDPGEHPTPQFILYNPDGTVHRTPLQPPADRGNGSYVYSLVDEDDYYVVELPMDGYRTEYVNQGEAEAVTDRVYAGGTIINTAVFSPPPTGDFLNPVLYLLLLAGSVTGMTLLYRRKK